MSAMVGAPGQLGCGILADNSNAVMTTANGRLTIRDITVAAIGRYHCA